MTTPHPVDLKVGARVRDLRVARGLNQSDLGRALGLTFQQVQKYEKGTNRISCSKIVGIADALSVTPAYFFAELEADTDPTPLPRAIPGRLVRALQDVPDRFMPSLAVIAEALARPEAP